jgi:uncharacterized SAM-binding protein YcdF (DUF218 family)
MERHSRNTQKNAEFAKALVSPKNGERWLLMTSAYHMARSVGIFLKAGFAVKSHPVDGRTSGCDNLPRSSLFSIEGLGRIDIASLEWLGLIAYWIIGKTSEFLPAPIER